MRNMQIGLLSCVTALVISHSLFISSVAAEEPASNFASPTIDVGVVVSDVDKAAKFYTEAIGFTEQKGFSVPADFVTDTGLADNIPLTVRVFTLGEGTNATKIKLIGQPAKKETAAKTDNAYVPSQLGFRYLTIFVTDIDASLARLDKSGIKPISKGAVELPKNLAPGVYLVLVRDPDGNFVELVGAKAKP